MALSGRAVIVGGVIAVVFGAIAAGLIVVGSPGTERMRRLDERRVRDLVSITRAVNRYWTRHARLPASLDELVDSPGTDVESRDPLTGRLYLYTVVGGKTYEVCAEFQGDSHEADADLFGRFWSHRAGRRCYRLDAEETHRPD